MRSKSEKWKQENAFFINSKTGKIQYNKKCLGCVNECKQSFRAKIVECKIYKPKTKGGQDGKS